VYNEVRLFLGGEAVVQLQSTQEALLPAYLASFDGLCGDRRTRVTLGETVKGIIGAGSLVCQQIAASSAILSVAKEGGQRVSRLARGESTKRSEINAETLTAALREQGLEFLSGTDAEELWLIADGSELRKPHAREMPYLMQVLGLNKKLVPGYRTMNVIGVVPLRRGILYHRLFSSKEEDFLSESLEVQWALETVSGALQEVKERMSVTWILDTGFDDVAVWRTIWEREEHVVCRLKHEERLVEYRGQDGRWIKSNVQGARQELQPMCNAWTEMVVRRGRQRKAKRQPVPVKISACPVRLTYQTNVRREGPGQEVQKELWLVEVRLSGTNLDPWLLLTDWPVTDADSALRIFRMYRQRWSVEDGFRFIKDVLGWEDVQLLDLEGIRTLLALGCVAAGFLYELGVTLEHEGVHLLARLGGWIPRKDSKPGKIVLTRGLRRLLDMLVTNAVLDRYRLAHGDLPPQIAAFLQPSPSGEL
jgi:hypothetical protein